MKIQLDEDTINIITIDRVSFKLPRATFNELYEAFSIIKELLGSETLDSIDFKSSPARKIYEIEQKGFS